VSNAVRKKRNKLIAVLSPIVGRCFWTRKGTLVRGSARRPSASTHSGAHRSPGNRQSRRRAAGRRRHFGDADHYGPGYRVYFVARGSALVILLAGGNKRTQGSDIATARELARNL
jgi:hypothetical protein